MVTLFILGATISESEKYRVHINCRFNALSYMYMLLQDIMPYCVLSKLDFRSIIVDLIFMLQLFNYNAFRYAKMLCHMIIYCYIFLTSFKHILSA